MKFPLSFSLILSQARAFINTTPVFDPRSSHASGMSRSDSTTRIEDMEKGDVFPELNLEDKIRRPFLDKPVSGTLDLVMEAIPLAVIGGLVALGIN